VGAMWQTKKDKGNERIEIHKQIFSIGPASNRKWK
jgi:hypothetical protein